MFQNVGFLEVADKNTRKLPCLATKIPKKNTTFEKKIFRKLLSILPLFLLQSSTKKGLLCDLIN